MDVLGERGESGVDGGELEFGGFGGRGERARESGEFGGVEVVVGEAGGGEEFVLARVDVQGRLGKFSVVVASGRVFQHSINLYNVSFKLSNNANNTRSIRTTLEA